jgi:hypothetical protein
MVRDYNYLYIIPCFCTEVFDIIIHSPMNSGPLVCIYVPINLLYHSFITHHLVNILMLKLKNLFLCLHAKCSFPFIFPFIESLTNPHFRQIMFDMNYFFSTDLWKSFWSNLAALYRRSYNKKFLMLQVWKVIHNNLKPSFMVYICLHN